MPSFPRAIIRGISVATNGMLSSIAERSADAQSITSIVATGCPPEIAMIRFASLPITPVCTIPPTTMKRHMKNNSVGHSTSAMTVSTSCFPITSITAAAVSATTQESIPRY